ncbi:MAG TPA: ATP-binding protein [Oxalicibacterium sp.]|nr:ATP-binding protein [Oxalicibacterium sp.]
MKLLPRTLFGQIVLALLAGLIAAQTVGFWLMLDDRVRLGERLRGTYTAQRVAGFISIIEHAGPAERERLLRALNIPPTSLTLDQPWHAAGSVDTDDARAFIARIHKELGEPLPIQVLSIRHNVRHTKELVLGPPRPPPEEEREQDEPPALPDRHDYVGPPIVFLIGQARLADGAVLTFRHSIPRPNMDWPLRLGGLLLVLVVSVALLAGWAVRRLTRPLASLADAASGLARNLEQPPLPESGPLEVARAAQAFNSMQRDLKRYVETRAQALAAVSHDLRLPITRLRLRMEKLADSELKSKMEHDLIEMDDMIGGTLAFLRAGSNQENAVRLDLNAFLESVNEDMLAVGARIRLSGQASQPILARPQALRRCLVNLLENARRYGTPEIDMSVAETNDLLTIRIEDRGAGMPLSEMERVFEPYVRLESSRARHTGGTGLGLAIARAIARAHGGDLLLAPREGGGLSAILTLPK